MFKKADNLLIATWPNSIYATIAVFLLMLTIVLFAISLGRANKETTKTYVPYTTNYVEKDEVLR